LVEAPVIFDPLQPDPIIDTIQGIPFAKQPGYEIIVGEISIQDTPAGKNSFPEKKPAENHATGYFHPGQDRSDHRSQPVHRLGPSVG
jgi:hypothetical protein